MDPQKTTPPKVMVRFPRRVEPEQWRRHEPAFGNQIRYEFSEQETTDDQN
jgi:hypothetical protein